MSHHDFESVFGSMEWERHEFLFLPRRPPPDPNAGMESFRQRVQLSDFTGETWDLETIRARLKMISREDWVAFLTRIDQFLYRAGYYRLDAQRQVINRWCPLTRLRNLLFQALNEGRMVLFPQQLLATIKLVLTSKDIPTGLSAAVDEQMASQMWFVMLAVADHLSCEFDEDIAKCGPTRALVRESVRNMSLHSSETLGTLFARYWRLLYELPQEDRVRSARDYMDIGGLFKEYLGFSVPRMIAMGIGIMTKFLSADDNLEVIVGIEPEEWFRSTSISTSEVNRLMGMLSLKVPVDGGDDHFFYNYQAFRDHPLVRFQDAYVPAHIPYLQDKLSEGLFWLLNDSISEEKSQKQQFRRFFGRLVEVYVQDLLARIVGDSPLLSQRLWTEFAYGRSQKSPDAIVSYGDTLIFFEIIASRPKYRATVVAGSCQALDDDIRILVTDPAKQLNKTITNFFKGAFVPQGLVPSSKTRVVPVIVSLNTLPQTVALRNIIAEKLTELNYLQDERIDRLEILDIGELEQIESAVLRRGTSLLQIVEERRTRRCVTNP